MGKNKYFHNQEDEIKKYKLNVFKMKVVLITGTQKHNYSSALPTFHQYI